MCGVWVCVGGVCRRGVCVEEVCMCVQNFFHTLHTALLTAQ